MTAKRTVLVTGGGSGIGRAVALLLQSSGWQVVIAGRRLDALQDTAGDSDIQCVRADLDKDGAGAVVVEQVVESHGRLDALVHCAGAVSYSAMHESTVEDLRAYMRVHVESAMDMVTAGWSSLQAAKPGRVVVFSSMAAHDPFPRVGVYGMAKAAGEAMVRAIHVDSGGSVLAFGVAPGCVDTPLLWSLFSPDDLEGVAVADPADIAAIVDDTLEGRCDECAGTTRVLESASSD